MIYRLTGGALSPDDPTYVERKQDTELFNKLLAGEYCYVFNSRQMGKSSLRVRTIAQLHKSSPQGCQCICIDMSMLSDFSMPKASWYESFFRVLFDKFDLENSRNFRDWMTDNQNLSNLERWQLFIEEILFRSFPTGKIYIFLEEIDTLGKCDFKEEFLGFIRSCFNRRAEDKNSDYHRLVFSFFGAVTPGDLIRNPTHTPFNIGCGIELTTLSFAEAKKSLIQGLTEVVEEPDLVLQKVFNWTGGQPFLTQKLCQIIVDYAENSRPDVDKLVEEHILTDWEDKDNPTHLKHIRDYLLNNIELLKLYQTILKRGKVKFNNSQVQMSLKLSGIVLKKHNKLVVFNQIYQRIFNLDWVEEQLANLVGLPKPKRWSMSFAIAGLLSLGVIGIRALGWLQPLELNMFDLLMRSRLPEKPDPNILIVEATQADINKFGIGNALKDEILAEVITNIDAFKPAIIGLDLWREKPLESEANYQKLLNILANNQKIIAVCSTSEYRQNKSGTIAPKGVPKERLGFTDIIIDNSQFKIVRRHLMFMVLEEKDSCKTGYSLSIRVALDFLATKGIKPENTPEGNVRIGDVTLKKLKKGQGIYQNIDDGGFQILLNYRNSDEVENKVAQIITISEVLNGEINDYLVKDKIVLIGITDPTASDKFYTPYSEVMPPNQKQMSGVVIHAHQVSQIISAVLDGRPLITFWSWWVEWLWIFAWIFLSCVVIRHCLRGFCLLLFTVGNIIVLYFVSWFILSLGFVVPLVPSLSILMLINFSVSDFILESIKLPNLIPPSHRLKGGS